jgi:hypothetical protein
LLLVTVAACTTREPVAKPVAADALADAADAATDAATDTDDGAGPDVAVGPGGSPQILLQPPKLNFGNVPVGLPITHLLAVLNQGDAPLQVSAVAVIDLVPHDGISLVAEPAGPFTVLPGGVRNVEITLLTEMVLPNPPLALPKLRVDSNDPQFPAIHVPVLAGTLADTPHLDIAPEPFLDFALVGVGATVARDVTLFNTGADPLQIGKVQLLDDGNGAFSLDAGFAPAAKVPQPVTVAPNASVAFQVVFTAKGPVGATAEGKLRITSNDTVEPYRFLQLLGTSASGSTCMVQWVPPTFDFGTLPHGATHTVERLLQNVGTGTCAFQDVMVAYCDMSNYYAFGCKPVPSPVFSAFGPSASLFLLAPGDTGVVQVVVTTPADTGQALDAVEQLDGLLVARFKDVASGEFVHVPNVDPQSGAALDDALPNLQARVGKVIPTATPQALHLGTATIGCKTPTRAVQVGSLGALDLWVTKATLQGCSPDFQPTAWPSLGPNGAAVAPGDNLAFGLTFQPSTPGTQGCQLVVHTGVGGLCTAAGGQLTAKPCTSGAGCLPGQWCQGQAVTVPLAATGTTSGDFADTFATTSEPADLLFIIDHTDGMGPYQQKLAQDFLAFATTTAFWQNDFHVGVISTTMKGAYVEPKAGKLHQIDGVRILTPGLANPPAAERFALLVALGDIGAIAKEGLAALVAAFAYPLTVGTGQACAGDPDCPGDAVCVRDPDDGVQQCGGDNFGFLRKHARLEIVVLSDEDDQSFGNVGDTIQFLQDELPNDGATLAARLHALVVTPTGCPGPEETTSVGGRYLAVAKATGGVVASICADSLVPALQAINALAFPPRLTFALSRAPDPQTLAVQVAGKSCTGGPFTWSYAAATQTVVFAAGSACQPKVGQQVVVTGKAQCLK